MSGDLVARCRAALAASDETAKGPLFPARTFAGTPIGGPDEERLALNRALTIVLDGIEATLAEHVAYPIGETVMCFAHRRGDGCPCPDHRRATASLAAIAEALGVQEEGP